MMAQKHLRELLNEDQEPFLLKDFIADRKISLLKSHSHLKKQKPTSESSIFPKNFCRKACFFHSQEPNKSPLFQFQSPSKNKNAVFLNVPSTTAALLLEAALRIQNKNSSSSKTRTGFGLFGSLLKRLNHRNQTQKEQTVRGNGVFRKSFSATKMAVEDSKSESHRFCSESSMEFQTCCSSPLSQNYEEIQSPSPESSGTNFAGDDFCLYESPFRFVLQPGSSPDFQPPELSPPRREDKDKKNHSVEVLNNLEVVAEEDKEQSSPVSVLDPPFQDDNYEEEEEDNFDENASDYEKAKQQLLNKLRRFEKLAGLDAIELEKRMEEEGEDEDELEEDGEEEEEEESVLESRFLNSKSRPFLKTGKRVSWRRSKTIETTVKEDFKTEIGEWTRSDREVAGEAVAEIELEIYSFLIEEFAWELLLVEGE